VDATTTSTLHNSKKKRKEEKKWYPDYITNSKNLANHKQANF
jgi:hypothetical protein